MKKLVLGLALAAAFTLAVPARADDFSSANMGVQAGEAFASYAVATTAGFLVGKLSVGDKGAWLPRVLWGFGTSMVLAGAMDFFDGQQNHFATNALAAGIGTVTILNVKF